MSSILLHDSGRSGSITWAEGLLRTRVVGGMILSPFSTPRRTIPRDGRTPAIPGASEARDRLHAEQGEVFFDPTTHGVLVPGADLFERYDTWKLWPSGSRGTTTPVALADHVERVLTRCQKLGLRPIAPTLPLSSATSPAAEQAFRMSEQALASDPDAYIAIVGSDTFWSSGSALDAYVGELVQLRPRGWAITVTRNALRYPWPGLGAEEVAGLCRTAHSLSLRGASVIFNQGDIAALPAVAAGVTHVGSGWDLRHRVCADDLFRQASGVRRASQRVTHRGLLASLKRDEAEALRLGDAALSARLVTGALPPDHNSHWRHHLAVLSNRVDRVINAGDRPDRVARLRRMYARAGTDFDEVRRIAGRLSADRRHWIDPLQAGLGLYAAGEGW